ARVLAKALNCENLSPEGEPCGECESCVAIEQGRSFDLHELDAASNNKVEDMRDLLAKVNLGTPGRAKVYILDEVHMLGPGASAALLKVLEEPPSHVVFVLATTDPQRLKDTIRSRTQHLQFHLLPSDTLAEHLQWVAEDAGIEIDPSVIDAALEQGGGSARDSLSALELLAATGGDVSDHVDLDEFVAAFTDADTGRALAAVAHAVSMGHDPRTLTEHLLRHLRNLFLSLMAPELVQVRHDRLDELAGHARDLGAAGLVRAMERLGQALVEMRFAPDPRIMLEISLVQLTRDDSGDDNAALLARLERLERAVRDGASKPAEPSNPVDPGTGKAVLGGRARRATETASAEASPAPAPADTPAPEPAPAPAEEAVADSGSGGVVDLTRLNTVWEGSVRAGLKPLVRALFSAGEFVAVEPPATARFRAPNAAHGARCASHLDEVARALGQALGLEVTIVLDDQPEVVAAPPAADDDPEEAIDPDELVNVPPSDVPTPVDSITRAFPGAQVVDKET
ncbi:MAG: ATP-binding protein, partial [Ilumatobacteraceae bacterium]